MLKKVFKVFWSVITAITFLVVAANEEPVRADIYPEVRVDHFALDQALLRAQGVTNDGEYYYFSSNLFLTKTELDAKTIVTKNLSAIPIELLLKGCVHIGGISYYDGKIYAPIEDSKVFKNLYVATYDAQTLKLIKYYEMPLEYHDRGIPWVVCDAQRGFLYSARPDDIEEINVFDLNTLEFIKTIPVDYPVDNIQGGEMYNGILYVSVSRGNQEIYAINPDTGEVKLAFARNIHPEFEGEGMTILATEDGALFHVLDIGSERLNVRFRHYAYTPEGV